MLGNWSFGDYFKRDAIHWAWDFLTRDLGIPEDRLAATTYTYDDVAWNIWRDEIGLPRERMARWGNVDAGDDKNFWRMAETGPCGPCSEIHFDRGAHLSEGPDCILRRILRRAVRHGRLLGRREPFLGDVAETVIAIMADAYPHLLERHDEVLAAIAREESQFARTLDAGTRLLEEALAGLGV